MKRTFLEIVAISVLSMFIGACGNSTRATKFSGTVIPKSTTEDAAKAADLADDLKVKSAAGASEGATTKPGVKLPGQFKCVARDSVWYSVAKLNETTIATDLTEKPMIEVTSDAKELNFKIGREFIEGEKINQELNPECKNTIEHTNQKYEWTFSCEYFVKNVDDEKQKIAFQKSYFKITSNGVGQLCRSVGPEEAQCWDLSECR